MPSLSEVTAAELIIGAVNEPSERFGGVIKELSHKALGQALRKHRMKAGVKAISVAKRLGFSKVQFHFLEQGKRRWNLLLVENYLDAVKDLAEQS